MSGVVGEEGKKGRLRCRKLLHFPTQFKNNHA
jgi:hypothetical protein